MRDRTEADDIVQGAANRALLGLILEPMRRVAKTEGYALTVHGSLNRDIDLVAVPWREHNVSTEIVQFAKKLANAVAGVTGNCLLHGGLTDKPHGRKAQLLMVYCGEAHTTLDLSIMPTVDLKNKEGP